MAQSPVLDFDVDDLALDVFELADSGLVVESLTAGHGMLENAASSGCSGCIGAEASCSSCITCSCSTCCSGCGGCGGNLPLPFSEVFNETA